jgi:hypothetical protein
MAHNLKRRLNMDLLFWVLFGFFLGGFAVLVSMKKNMERWVAALKTDGESSSVSSLPVVWWILATTVWGVGSMWLVVWWFSVS